MGIYDREYYRDDVQRQLAPSWNNRSIISMIIIGCVAVFVINMLTGRDNWFNELLLLQGDLSSNWARVYTIITYAFVHDPQSLLHLLFNMFSLWMLGRAVEERYGKTEFAIVYFLSAIAGSLLWLGLNWGSENSLLGASGAVSCVMMLFVLNYPKTIISIWGVLPVQAWIVGVLMIVFNIIGGRRDVAYEVHLAGIAFAVAYFFSGFRFQPLIAGWQNQAARRKETRLRIHKESVMAEDEEADRILDKIHRQGQDSLTRSERKFMEKYSRRVRKEKQNF